jgi:hypothetical protein
MISVVAQITMGNIRQASGQEDSMRAYYIARSGAELAYEVLLTTTPSRLTEFVDDPGKVLSENDVDFGEGSADIRITSSGSGETQMITVESIGTLDGATTSRTVKLDFYINYDDYPDIRWYH